MVLTVLCMYVCTMPYVSITVECGMRAWGPIFGCQCQNVPRGMFTQICTEWLSLKLINRARRFKLVPVLMITCIHSLHYPKTVNWRTLCETRLSTRLGKMVRSPMCIYYNFYLSIHHSSRIAWCIKGEEIL